MNKLILLIVTLFLFINCSLEKQQTVLKNDAEEIYKFAINDSIEYWNCFRENSCSYKNGGVEIHILRNGSISVGAVDNRGNFVILGEAYNEEYSGSFEVRRIFYRAYVANIAIKKMKGK
jgi:hypothetical protein